GKQGPCVDCACKSFEADDMSGKGDRTDERQEIAKIRGCTRLHEQPESHCSDSDGHPHTSIESTQNQWYDDDIERRNECGVRCCGIFEADCLEDIADHQPTGGDCTSPQNRRLAVQVESEEKIPSSDQHGP